MKIKTKLLRLFLCVGVLMACTVMCAFAAKAASKPDTVMATATFYDYEKSDVTGKKYLLFGQGAATDSGSYNSWTKENDWRISKGIVEDTLDENGNVVLSSITVRERQRINKKWVYVDVEKQLTVPKTVSGRLYADDEKVGTYEIPFTYDKELGKYIYDSKDYRMLINYDTNVVECSEYPTSVKRFLPLDADSENFYFGMVTSLPFVYVNDGRIDGKDMVFDFAGDDDVWVFVDGKLALDMGGIHNAVSGSINFRTGEVKTVGKIEDGDADDKVTVTALDGFDRSVKNHELKVFYLERGAGESNFKLSFNLAFPTNYTVKYYDGKYYNGKTGDEGLIATTVQTAREDGTSLYAGDEVKQSEIKININKTTADLIASDDYYGGYVVDENFIAVTDPNKVVATVTDDDTDIVYVVFIPKPSYTVTYWLDENGERSQITQKVFLGKDGQAITKSDVDLSLEFDGYKYENGVIETAETDGVLGVLNFYEPFNVDVVYTVKKEAGEEDEPDEVVSSDPYTLNNTSAYIFGRTNLLMEAEDNIYRGEASAVLYRLLKQNDMLNANTDLPRFEYHKDNPAKFADLDGRWDRSAIEYMAYIGMYKADSEASIYPDAKISRGEAFKLFALSLGFTKDAALTNEQYAQILVDRGYVQGFEDGSLRLDENITRAQFCVIYNKITGRSDDYFKLVTKDGTQITPETYGFTDFGEDNWYYTDMLKATSAYDDEGYVSIEKRGIRNVLDDFADVD